MGARFSMVHACLVLQAISLNLEKERCFLFIYFV